jgi:hypothetical protein
MNVRPLLSLFVAALFSCEVYPYIVTRVVLSCVPNRNIAPNIVTASVP